MKHEAGFTLIEMITVIAIIATLLAFSIPNLRDGRVRQDVKHAARQFAADMLYAQTQTLAQNTADEGQTNVYPMGIKIAKTDNGYTVFEDTNPNGTYDGPPADVQVSKVDFLTDVTLKDISVGNTSPSGINTAQILFAPVSDGSVKAGSPICDIDCTQPVHFLFSSNDPPSYTIEVVLNPSGLIEKP